MPKPKQNYFLVINRKGQFWVTRDYYNPRSGYAQFGPFSRVHAVHVGKRITQAFLRNFFKFSHRIGFEFGQPCWYPWPLERCLCNVSGPHYACRVYHPQPNAT